MTRYFAYSCASINYTDYILKKYLFPAEVNNNILRHFDYYYDNIDRDFYNLVIIKVDYINNNNDDINEDNFSKLINNQIVKNSYNKILGIQTKYTAHKLYSVNLLYLNVSYQEHIINYNNKIHNYIKLLFNNQKITKSTKPMFFESSDYIMKIFKIFNDNMSLLSIRPFFKYILNNTNIEDFHADDFCDLSLALFMHNYDYIIKKTEYMATIRIEKKNWNSNCGEELANYITLYKNTLYLIPSFKTDLLNGIINVPHNLINKYLVNNIEINNFNALSESIKINKPKKINIDRLDLSNEMLLFDKLFNYQKENIVWMN